MALNSSYLIFCWKTSDFKPFCLCEKQEAEMAWRFWYTHTPKCGKFAGREAEGFNWQEMSVVTLILSALTDRPMSTLDLADNYDQLYATVGWHRLRRGLMIGGDYLLDKLRHPKSGGSGRRWAGLSLDDSAKDFRRRVFRRQSNSLRTGPTHLSYTRRDALEDTMKLSRRCRTQGGIMHSYSGSLEMAERFIELGWFPFLELWPLKKATDIQEGCAEPSFGPKFSLDDTPYLAPVPKHVVEKTKQLYSLCCRKLLSFVDWLLKKCAQATYENAKKVFGLDWEDKSLRWLSLRAKDSQSATVLPSWYLRTRGSAINEELGTDWETAPATWRCVFTDQTTTVNVSVE